MAISSVTLLNSNGVDASLAKLREGSLSDFLAAQPQVTTSTAIRISAPGKALMSLDSLQASAEAVKNANVPPTVADFKVLVDGVVSAINSIRQSIPGASIPENSLVNNLRKRQDAVGRVADQDQELVAALRKIGVERQDVGGFSVNQKRLLKAFNEDPKNVFATFADFTKKVSDAADSNLSDEVKDKGKVRESSKQKEKPGAFNAYGQADNWLSSRDRIDVLPSPPISFAAQSAVNSYLTVASL